MGDLLSQEENCKTGSWQMFGSGEVSFQKQDGK